VYLLPAILLPKTNETEGLAGCWSSIKQFPLKAITWKKVTHCKNEEELAARRTWGVWNEVKRG